MAATVAYITARDREEALRIGTALLESRLVACINILDNMGSVYWWQGKLETAEECVLMAKTVASRQDGIIRMVKDMHGYQVPCVVFWPLSGGNPEYLDWIEKETRDA
ncbi:MAG TPA: divalent-cation tolerance protein CutA [Fibrobacteria bacterium]|nr:divalent-cation tolerance protein CutA [Fibrobacteria bacterium]